MGGFGLGVRWSSPRAEWWASSILCNTSGGEETVWCCVLTSGPCGYGHSGELQAPLPAAPGG